MDKISSYFNDCFSDNYFVFILTHKTNVNIDAESKHIETTKTIIFDQSIQEEANREEGEEEKKKTSKVSIISKESGATSRYVFTLNIEMMPPKAVKSGFVYPLQDFENGIYSERKFDDFLLLRKAIIANYPACFIPVIPPKSYFALAKTNIEDRKNKAIKEFWLRIFELPHITSSDIIQYFVDPNCNIQKALDRCLKPSSDEIVQRYKNSFKNLGGLSVDENLYLKIDKFEEFATMSLKRVKQLVEQMKNYQKAEGGAISAEQTFYSQLQTLEQFVLMGNYSEGNVPGLNSDFMLQLSALNKLPRSSENHVQLIIDFLMYEIYDFEMILESLKTKRKFDSLKQEKKGKLLALRKEASETFNKVDKLTKLMNSIELLEQECSRLDLLINLMNANIGYFEIEKYKISKYRMYCEMLKSFCKLHSPMLHKVKDFIDSIIELITSKQLGTIPPISQYGYLIINLKIDFIILNAGEKLEVLK